MMAFHLIVLAVALIHLGFSQTDDTRQLHMNYVEKNPIFKPTASSCLDYLKSGYKKNGFYTIVDGSSKYVAFCDLETEPGMAWTLAMSHSLENTQKLRQFKNIALLKNAPVNEYNPNWYAYRMSKTQMDALAKASTHYRYTCSEYGEFRGNNNFRDYLRGAVNGKNPLTLSGNAICASVEYINIRGIPCAHCQVAFYQVDGAYIFTHDASTGGCGYSSAAGSVSSEDNFGYYGVVNPKFGCTKYPTSTTNIWLGARR